MQDHPRLRSAARSLRAATVLLAVCLLGSVGRAQMSDAEARAEIAFAKGLAADWGFVSLAEEVIGDLEQAGTSAKVGEELRLLKCEIYFIAAQNDPANRDAFCQKSLESYQRFLEENEYSEHVPEAQAKLVSVASYYAKSMAMQLETEAGEEADALRSKLNTVLTTAIEMTGKLVDALSSVPSETRTEADKRQLYNLLLDRGDLLLELAKVQEDGTYSFEQSFRAYERLVDEAGLESPYALRAFVGIGDNFSTQGEWDEASGYYQYVVNSSIPIDEEQWEAVKKERDLSKEDIDRQFLFVQLGTQGLVKSLTQAGKGEEAARWGLHFYNTWKREGLNLVRPLGHLSLLAVARTLVDAGGWIGGSLSSGDAKWFADRTDMEQDFPARRDQRPALDLALSMAQSVNDENRGNTLQLRAQKVISEIISRPGVHVDPEILFEAAQGEFFDKNYPRAITSFKRVLAALDSQDEATRREIGPKTLWHIGRSFQYLDRPIEAAVTFQEAVSDRWRGDPEYDGQNAGRYYEIMKVLTRGNKDALLQTMLRESEQKASELTASKGADIQYKRAEEVYRDGQYEDARKLYAGVESSAEFYERAIVFVGVCDYQLDRFEQAEQEFDDYLNKFLKDPINTTNDPRRTQRRSEASAAANFYWGLLAYKQADAAAEGQGNWQKVVDKLGDFDQRFPQQDEYAPAALYRVMIAFTRMNQNPKARAVYETMLKEFPKDRWTGKASVDFYKILKDQQQEAADPERKRALLRQMAEALQVLNSTSPSPSFASMRTESRHWMELGEWEMAEELLERIETKFAGQEDGDIDKYVRPDLGRALLEQHKVQEAAAVLKPLVDKKIASAETARNYAISVTGWIEYTESADHRGVIEQVPGIGGKELEQAADTLNTLAESSEHWEPAWYGYKLDLIYAYYQWGQVDGKKLATAEDQINYLSSNLGARFENEKIPEPMRQKFLWLASELK